MSNLETILRHRFRLLRFIDDKLISSDCEIECEISVTPNFNSIEIQSHLSAMKLWLDNFVDGSIAYAYEPDSVTDISWLGLLENNLIMAPSHPADHIILSVLHTKLRTIGNNVIQVEKTHFISDTAHGFSNTLSGPADEWLPKIDEWIGQRHFHKNPWWYRGDASSIDVIPAPDDDLSILPNFGENLVDIIRSDYETGTDEPQQQPQEEIKSAEIIKPSFKPKLIVTNED
jgi:hypothetical protein